MLDNSLMRYLAAFLVGLSVGLMISAMLSKRPVPQPTVQTSTATASGSSMETVRVIKRTTTTAPTVSKCVDTAPAVSTTVEEEVVETTKAEEKKEVSTQQVEVQAPRHTDYAVGVVILLSVPNQTLTTDVGVGARLGSLPAFLEFHVAANVDSHTFAVSKPMVGLGLRVEF